MTNLDDVAVQLEDQVRCEPFCDGTAMFVRDRHLKNQLHAVVNAFWGLPYSYRNFPGAQPVPLTREKLTGILEQPEKWRVAKKSNGVRCALLFLSRDKFTRGVQLIVDRRDDYRFVYFEAPDSVHHGTVLDGELLQELVVEEKEEGRRVTSAAPDPDKPKKYQFVFYVFDVVAVGGLSTILYRHSDRMLLLHHLLSEITPTPNSPFKIIVKEFYPILEWARFLEQERITPTGESLPPEKHPFDGVICIQQNRPVTVGEDSELCKCKNQKLNTNDFFVLLTDGGITELYLADENDQPCMFARQPTSLTQQLIEITNRDLAPNEEPLTLESLNNGVVECCPELESSVQVTSDGDKTTNIPLDKSQPMKCYWRPYRLRREKKQPNTVQHAQSNLRVIAENISFEELSRRFLSLAQRQ